MENTYWSKKGKYQNELDSLFRDLVPSSGKCDTLAGELVRAANKLYYDFNNNGMGNNTSGAINFLNDYQVLGESTFSTIYEYTRGRCYEGRYNGDLLQLAMERMMDTTIEYILNRPETKTITNHKDMFDYQEDDINYCEECGEEHEGWGCLCERCEWDSSYYEER